MLSQLQRDLVTLIGEVDVDGRFAFAGAGALMTLGVIDRATHDVDFFATSGADVDALRPRLVAAIEARGLDVRELRGSPGFSRLEVRRGEEVSLIDLGFDNRQWATRSNPLGVGQILAVEELVAGKVLALFARGEVRDFADTWQLAERFGRDRLIELAGAKDDGFSVRYFEEMLGRFERFDRADFDLDDVEYVALGEFVRQWRVELSPPRPPPPSLGL